MEPAMITKSSRFDASAMKVLALAFDRAWAMLRSADETALTDIPHARRYAIAKRIVTKANEGVMDPNQLASDAFSFVRETVRPASA
jgi:hypothetical protein